MREIEKKKTAYPYFGLRMDPVTKNYVDNVMEQWAEDNPSSTMRKMLKVASNLSDKQPELYMQMLRSNC